MQADDALRALLQERLFAFTQRSFYTLNPGQTFQAEYHIRALCHQLERVANGEVKRLAVAMPPRHLKSHVGSIAFPAWLLGRKPETRIVGASYETGLARTFSLQCRQLMQQPWFRDAFPKTRLSPDRNTADEIRTTRNGYRLATSVGGPLTGKGGDVLIIDDPMKAGEANSDANRQAVKEWYRSTVSSRLDRPKDGAIVLIAQRLHIDDLFGAVTDEEGWEILDLPAIAVQDEEIALTDRASWTRVAGEVLDPERVGRAELDQIKRELGSALFEAQYQQRPAMPEGNLIQLDWFGTYDAAPADHEVELIVQSWDTASVPGEGNDYSVGTTWGIRGRCFYLLDVIRERLNYPDLRARVLQAQRDHDADCVIVEQAGTGISLFQDLRRDGHDWIRTLKPVGDKESRAAHQSAKIERGMVLLPAEAAWRQTFEDEVAVFPHGKHDDQVDSMVQFLRATDARKPPFDRLTLHKAAD